MATSFREMVSKCLIPSRLLGLRRILVSSIISEDPNLATQLFPKENILFLYRVIQKTINSYHDGKYSDFDAHTTSNCCHGMALLARDVILSLKEYDLHKLYQDLDQSIQELEKTPFKQHPCALTLPKPIVELTSLYILAFIREIDPKKGGRTSAKKLKLISTISTNFCIKIVNFLQKRLSNQVAMRYSHLLQHLNGEKEINGVPIKFWGKYVQLEALREDKYGILYSSNLYSMQIVLAYAVKHKIKIAMINDLLDNNGKLKDRIFFYFEGDGNNHLKILPTEDANLFNSVEPILVFGGCVYSDKLNRDDLITCLQPWLQEFESLVLACDVFYPQFPEVIDDYNFNADPIIPEEHVIHKTINKYASVSGVSSIDPSLFCLTHIYPASIKQIVKSQIEQNLECAPISFIPGNKFVPLPEEKQILN